MFDSVTERQIVVMRVRFEPHTGGRSGLAGGFPGGNYQGYVSLEADGTSGTEYVRHARHSRVLWDYIADPYVDPDTDVPTLLYQQQRPASGTCADGDEYDELGVALGDWDDTANEWTWDVQTDAGCPRVMVDNVHDNSFVPLPNGEFRVYFKAWTDSGSFIEANQFYVKYWNGAAWATWYDGDNNLRDSAPVDFVWDGDNEGPSDECIGNVAAIINFAGGTPHEGMFFQVLDDKICDPPSESEDDPRAYVGLDDDARASGDDGAIVFAHLDN